MLDPLSSWTNAFTNLAPAADDSWADNMADAVDGLVTNKLAVTTISPSATFTFNKAIFAAQLKLATPTDNAVAGCTNFADAWGSAVTASTLVVAPGSYLGAPTPATTWSVVILSLVDPASIAAAKAALVIALTSATPVANAALSAFPSAFRTAFATLTASVTGLDSTPSPAGPLPLNVSAQPMG